MPVFPSQLWSLPLEAQATAGAAAYAWAGAATAAALATVAVAGAAASAPPAAAVSAAAVPACASSPRRHHPPRRVTGAKAPTCPGCHLQVPSFQPSGLTLCPHPMLTSAVAGRDSGKWPTNLKVTSSIPLPPDRPHRNSPSILVSEPSRVHFSPL